MMARPYKSLKRPGASGYVHREHVSKRNRVAYYRISTRKIKSLSRSKWLDRKTTREAEVMVRAFNNDPIFRKKLLRKIKYRNEKKEIQS